jgi:hypothetical protein
MRAFKGCLYLGTGIPLGFNPVTHHGPRGCSVLRIAPEGDWELIVGKRRRDPLSDYRAGFGWYLNAYCWYMKEYDDYLYLGTWDLSRTLAFLGQSGESVAPAFKPLLNELVADPKDWGAPMGGDLYRTANGVHWEPVFLDGTDGILRGNRESVHPIGSLAAYGVAKLGGLADPVGASWGSDGRLPAVRGTGPRDLGSSLARARRRRPE